jgi:PAS domain S-box-containing protein
MCESLVGAGGLESKTAEDSRWRCAFESTGDGLWDWDTLTNKVFFSTAFKTMLGYSENEIGENLEEWTSRVHPDDFPGCMEDLHRYFRGETANYANEHRVRCKDGSYKWILDRGKVISWLEPGKPARMVGTHKDITQARLKEIEIARVLALHRGIVEHAAHGIITTSVEGIVTAFNPAAEKMLGYAAQEIVGLATPAKWHDEGEVVGRARDFSKELGECIEPGFAVFTIKATRHLPNQYEWTFIRKDGSRFPVLLTVTALSDSSGQVTGFLGLILDITEHKKSEAQLRHSQSTLATRAALFERAIDIAKVGWWELDLLTMKHFWSAGTCRILETDPPIAPPVAEGVNMYAPEVRPIIQAAVQAGIEEGASWDLELPAITAKGRNIWVRAQGSAVVENGKTVKLLGAFQDITSRKEIEQEQHKFTQRLSLACTAGGIGVWELNTASNELIWDDQMFVLYGGKRDDFTGTYETWKSGVHPDDIEKIESELGNAIKTGQRFDSEFRIVWPDGSIHTIRALANVIRNGMGEATLMIGTNWDITERNRAETELKTAKEAAESSNRAKSEFLASMSHEIRTPMNGVLGLTQLLAETTLSREQREWVQTIQSSGDSLLIILNDILDLSKIEAGKLTIERLSFNPKVLVEGIVELLGRSAKSKGIELTFNCDENLPPRLFSDPSRIRQVIFNLLGNAVKFTSKGEVKITVRWENGTLKVAIQDSGIGIPTEKQNRIFKMFSQVDATTSRKFGGTGLGLAISKRLMELMGGEIGFESEDGKGSCFWTSLPLEIDTQIPVLKEKESAHQKELPSWIPVANPFANHRILLVEDNSVNQMVTGGMLEKMGFQFDLAQNGFQAVDMAFKREYSVILMDCEMPGMDGYQATREIRRCEAESLDSQGKPLCQRVIIALTANAMAEDEARCLASGMDAFLSKPLRKSALRQALVSRIMA